MITILSRRTAIVVWVVALLCLAPAQTRAEDTEGLEGAGMGAAAMLTTLVYGPVKLAYAATGGVVGGLAWLLTAGNNDVAIPIIESAVYGDYYITPAQLSGEQPIEFVGRESRDSGGVASDGVPAAPESEPDDRL
jgi:hypothetical protein